MVNATIAWDSFVHNTLWIVGHFHHMALLNIGIVIFGAIYTFLPDLIGKQLYSDRMGMWHVWLTTFAATAFKEKEGLQKIWTAFRSLIRTFSRLPLMKERISGFLFRPEGDVP